MTVRLFWGKDKSGLWPCGQAFRVRRGTNHKQPRPPPSVTATLAAKKPRKPGGRIIYGVTVAEIEE
jgi:hypothetical protein